MLTLKANTSTAERKPQDVWAQGDGFTLREQCTKTASVLSPTGTVRHDYTPPRVRFTYQPTLLCLSFPLRSPERLYLSSAPLSLMHMYTNTPSNLGLKHTDFNLRVMTNSTGARGFGLPSRNTCLVYILHHTDTVWRLISFLFVLENKPFC